MASDVSRPENGPSAPPPDAAAGSDAAGSHPAVSPGRPGRLDLGDAIHDGWQAFCRAPRVFTAFALLVSLLILLQQPLMVRIGTPMAPSTRVGDWILYAIGLTVVVGAFLWGSLGLGRGSVLALQGRRPTLAELLRWDRRTWLRLLRSWWRLLTLVGLPSGGALLLFGLPLVLLEVEPQLQQALGRDLTFLLALTLAALLLLTVALTLVALLYLTVNQAFLLQIVLLEGCAGIAAVRRGQELVDPQWPLVLLLVLLLSILNGVGLLACAVGSVVAWPAVICISTAAYQQLRAAETGAPSA